jgi:hypothetical protein
MLTIVKSEWYQVERRFELELNAEIISQIYPDFPEHEIQEVLDEIASGKITVTTVLEDAKNNGVSLDFSQMEDGYSELVDWLEPLYELTDNYPAMDSAQEVAGDSAGPSYEPELSCHNCQWEGSRTQSIVENTLLMCPECGSPVGHTDSEPQVRESWEELNNQLYDMMRKND